MATDVTLMNYDFVSFRAQRLLISSSSMALVGTREYNWISFNWLPTRSCLEMTTRKNRGHDKSFPCTQTLNTELVHSVLNHPKMSPFKIDSTIEFLAKIQKSFFTKCFFCTRYTTRRYIVRCWTKQFFSFNFCYFIFRQK